MTEYELFSATVALCAGVATGLGLCGLALVLVANARDLIHALASAARRYATRNEVVIEERDIANMVHRTSFLYAKPDRVRLAKKGEKL